MFGSRKTQCVCYCISRSNYFTGPMFVLSACVNEHTHTHTHTQSRAHSPQGCYVCLLSFLQGIIMTSATATPPPTKHQQAAHIHIHMLSLTHTHTQTHTHTHTHTHTYRHDVWPHSYNLSPGRKRTRKMRRRGKNNLRWNEGRTCRNDLSRGGERERKRKTW